MLRILMTMVSLALPMAGQSGRDGFRPVVARVEMDRDAALPGETLRLALSWYNAGSAPARYDYRVFVHARLAGAPEDGSVPMFGGDYTPVVETYRWHPRRMIRDTGIPLPIPANAKPGRYLVLVGLFNEAGRAALGRPEQASPEYGPDRAKVAEFTVLAPGEEAAAKAFARDLAPHPTRPPDPPRAAPTGGEEVVLVGGSWQARLAPDVPVLRRMVYPMRKLSFKGGDADDAPQVELYRSTDGRRAATRQPNVVVEYRRLETGDPGRVAYAATVLWDSIIAVEMQVEFAAEPDGLRMAVRQVREYPPHQLMAVTFSSLLSLSSSVPGTALVTSADGGRLIPLDRVAPKREMPGMDWFNPVLLAMAQQRNAVAVLEPDSLEDRLRVQVVEDSGTGANPQPSAVTPSRSVGSLGVRLVHRLPAKDAAHQIRVQAEMGARLTFLNGPGADWQAAARRLRARWDGALAPVYRRALIYKIFCDVPGAERPATTFEQALALIRRIAALTDGAPQVAYLVGWQYRGHDTGYPAVDRVNERLGGLEGLKRLVEEARKVHGIVSAHDNYDDAYRDSPAWDESLIARDENGALMKGGVWAGGQSYILGAARYAASGRMQARVADTLDRYPFRDTYHIDVLTAVPVRHDYDPARPSDAAGSLLGKLAVVRAFQARGVDVSSEGLTAPFVGPVTYFWHLQRRPEPHFEGETRIPLVPFLLHGPTGYGGGIGPTDEDVLEALLYGANWSEDLTADTPTEHILDRFYFVNLPWQALSTRRMERYTVQPDGTARVDYGPKSFVEVNRASRTYRVVVDGQTVSQDFRTIAPGGPGRWLAYAREAQEIALPSGATTAYRLLADGSREEVVVTGGRFRAEARTPYLLR